MKKLSTIFALLSVAIHGFAQDQQFTQFYALPTHLNPAFAGASVQSRVGMQYRNQWAAIPGAFHAGNVAYDQFIPTIKSGVGALIQHDQAGSGGLRSTSLQFQYAYEARIKRNWFVRPALQFGYVNKAIDFDKLRFYDQMIRGDAPQSLERPIFQPVSYFDFGAGLLTYGPNFWFGFSAFHLNRPNESLYTEGVTMLPRRYSAQGGLRFKMKKNSLTKLDQHLVFAAHYQSQQQFDQLDVGFYYELSPIVLGLWYRGLPAKSNQLGYPNHDAVALLLGFQAGSYKIGYSYDITVSTLGVGSSAGSHELTMVYQWTNKKHMRAMKRRIMPCAKF